MIVNMHAIHAIYGKKLISNSLAYWPGKKIGNNNMRRTTNITAIIICAKNKHRSRIQKREEDATKKLQGKIPEARY